MVFVSVLMNPKCVCHSFFQKFFITTDIMQQDENERDLSELRVDLLKSTAIKLLEVMGYELTDMGRTFKEESTVCLHFSTKCSEVVPGYQRVLCGVVLNSRHHNKSSTITAQEYLRCVCYMLELRCVCYATELCLTTAVFLSAFTMHVKIIPQMSITNVLIFIAMKYEVSHEWWVIHNLVLMRYLMSVLLVKDI